MMGNGPLDLLCDAHNIRTLMFLGEHDGCLKSEIYESISRVASMPRKLETLESAGLISTSRLSSGKATRIYLTDVGRRVVELLKEIERTM